MTAAIRLQLQTTVNTTMAKKRKASGLSNSNSKHNDTSAAQSSKLTINSYEDVADSEDEFLINRDKVMLDDGPEAKRRRRIQEEGMHEVRSPNFTVLTRI